MKKYLIFSLDAGTMAFHYDVLHPLYSGSSKAFILCRSGLKRGVYVLPSYEPQSRYHNLKFQLDTKCASGKPLVVHCTSDPDELETCNLLQNPPKTSINSLQLKLRRPTNNQKELKVSLGHDSAGEGATINNVYRPFHCNIYMNWPVRNTNF